MWERKWLPGEADLTLSVAGKPPVAMESKKFNQAADFKKACHYFCVPNNILKRECPAWSTSGPCGNPHYYTRNPPKTTQLGQSTTWSTSTLIVKMSKNLSLFFCCGAHTVSKNNMKYHRQSRIWIETPPEKSNEAFFASPCQWSWKPLLCLVLLHPGCAPVWTHREWLTQAAMCYMGDSLINSNIISTLPGSSSTLSVSWLSCSSVSPSWRSSVSSVTISLSPSSWVKLWSTSRAGVIALHWKL